jgi:hypothetical protein
LHFRGEFPGCVKAASVVVVVLCVAFLVLEEMVWYAEYESFHLQMTRARFLTPRRLQISRPGQQRMAATAKELKEREAFAMGKHAKKANSALPCGSPSAAEKAAMTKRFKKAGPGHSLRDEGGGGEQAEKQAEGAEKSESANGGAAAAERAGGQRAGGNAASVGGSRRRGTSGMLLSGVEASGIASSLGSEISNVSAAESDMTADLVYGRFSPPTPPTPPSLPDMSRKERFGCMVLSAGAEFGKSFATIRSLGLVFSVRGSSLGYSLGAIFRSRGSSLGYSLGAIFRSRGSSLGYSLGATF